MLTNLPSKFHGRPIGLVVISALLLYNAINTLLIGLYIFIQQKAPIPIDTNLLFLVGFLVIFIGILALAAAIGVWNMKVWGRNLATIVSVVYILKILTGDLISFVAALLILMTLWFDKNSKDEFKKK